MEASSKLNILFFTAVPWEQNFKKPYIKGLSLHTNLMCVLPPIGLDTSVRRFKEFRESIKERYSVENVSSNFYLYRPITAVSYIVPVMFPYLEVLNVFPREITVKNIMKKLGMRDIILVIDHPVLYWAVGRFGERIMCYDVYDEYAKLPMVSSVINRRLQTFENSLLKKADIVFTTSRNLMERKRVLNPNTHFIANAADVEFFMTSLSASTQVPSELLKIKSPRIGCIGHFSELWDFELINFLARTHPDWSIVMIGPIKGSSSFKQSDAFIDSCSLPNIHYLGPKDYETLPAYQKGLDVCLIPYRFNDYTVNIYPNKLHQHLAGGKPVISTDLPEIRPYKDVVAIGRSHNEFLKLVRDALNDNSSVKIKRRTEVAKENSIESGIRHKIDLMRQCLTEKTRTRGLTQC